MINCEDYALLCQNSWEVYSKILRNILRDITDVVQILYGPDRRWLLFATSQNLSCAPNGPRFSTQPQNAPGAQLTSLSQFLRGPAGALLSFYLGAGTDPPVLCMFWLDLANKQVASPQQVNIYIAAPVNTAIQSIRWYATLQISLSAMYWKEGDVRGASCPLLNTRDGHGRARAYEWGGQMAR